MVHTQEVVVFNSHLRYQTKENMKIVNTDAKIELSKRFYAPAEVHDDCPGCGAEVVEDFDDRYMMYPVTNEPFKVHLHCQDCEEEWSHTVILRIRLEKAKT